MRYTTKWGPEPCSSWPPILVTLFCLLQFALIMAQTFLPRFAQNVGFTDSCAGIFSSVQDSSQACSVLYPYTFTYAPANYDGTSSKAFLDVTHGCSYDYVQPRSCTLFNCYNSTCPNQLFMGSFHASQTIVVLGVLSAVLHFAPLTILMIVYSCHCCCRGEIPGRRMLIAVLFTLFVSFWFQIGQVIAANNMRNEFESFNGVPTQTRAGGTINVISICIDVLLFIAVLIYLFVGGREKVYCECRRSQEGFEHDDDSDENSNSVVIVNPNPMPNMIQTQDLHQQPGLVQLAPGQVFMPQGQGQPQMYFVPPAQPQYVSTQQQPYVQLQF